MFNLSCNRYALTAALLVGAVMPALTEAAAPDATLYTSYTVATNLTSATWGVCGSTQQTEGCYSFGNLGPFGKIGSMLEGNPVVNGNTVTRDLYVLDVASGTAANGVTLSIYTKTDVVTASDDQTTVTLQQTINLPLVGGTTVSASMAANSTSLFVGTNQSNQAVRLTKGQWTLTTVGGFSPPAPVAAITADVNGDVIVTFGAPGGPFSGFVVFGPTGSGLGDGGGSDFLLNDMNAVAPQPLPF